MQTVALTAATARRSEIALRLRSVGQMLFEEIAAEKTNYDWSSKAGLVEVVVSPHYEWA